MSLKAGLRAYALLWAGTILGAVAGSLTGDAFVHAGPYRRGAELFADVAVTNARLVGALALAAAWVHALPSWRAPLDVTVVSLAAVNVVAVGAAIGAAGPRLLPALVHLPFEWAAIAAALTLYVGARSRRLSRPTWIRSGGACAALVLIAAAVEAWAPVG